MRGGEGGRLRPRRGAGRPSRGRRRSAAGWPSPRWPRRPRCAAAGIAAPILLLSEPRPADLAEVLAADVAVTAYTPDLIAPPGCDGRVGGPFRRRPPEGRHRHAPRRRRARRPRGGWPSWSTRKRALSLAAVWTHCAVADEPDDPFTARQLERFDAAVAAVEAAGIPVPHAPRRQLRRGHRPSGEPLRPRAVRHRRLRDRAVATAASIALALEPAVRLATEVAFVKPVAAGEGVSVRPAAPRRPRHPRRHAADRLRRRRASVRWGCSARRCSSAVAAIRWSAWSRWIR